MVKYVLEEGGTYLLFSPMSTECLLVFSKCNLKINEMPEYDSLVQTYELGQEHNIQIEGVSIEEQIKLPGHSWNVSCLRFSQNGLYLASGSWDKTVRIWDLRTLDTPKVLDGDGKGHTSAVTCLSWLPQIEFLLSSGSADNSILIWNSDTGDVMARLNQHESWVLGTSFTEDGRILASSSWDGTVILWDMNVLKPVNQLIGHTAGVWACSFNQSNSSPILCTASEDTSLRLWDMRSDEKWHSDIILSGVHTDAIKCCVWSPCGYYLAAGSKDSKISIWDVRVTKAVNCLHGHTSEVSDISFLPSASNLLFSVGDTKCCFWNTFSPQAKSIGAVQQHSWSYEVESLSIAPDSTLLATGSVDKHITLSTIDVTDDFREQLHSDVNILPYAKLPVASSPSMQNLTLATSSADVVDKAKAENINRERETNLAAAKQTLRIKAPVTSSYLQDKLSKLKTVNNEKQENTSFFDGLKIPEKKDDGSIRFKSKELVAERKRLRPSLSQMTDNKAIVKDTKNSANMNDEDIKRHTSLLTAELNEQINSPRSSLSSEYDIDTITNGMIKLTEEEQQKQYIQII